MLTTLQTEAAELLARGYSPKTTRDFLQIGLASFEQWRSDPEFNDKIERLRNTDSGAIEGESLLEAAHAFGALDDIPILEGEPHDPEN